MYEPVTSVSKVPPQRGSSCKRALPDNSKRALQRPWLGIPIALPQGVNPVFSPKSIGQEARSH